MTRPAGGTLGRSATAAACLGALLAWHSSEQEPAVSLDWSDAILEVPLVDLTGSWSFVEAESDPMVEAWRGREVQYLITQTPDRIVLDFRPAEGTRTLQGYRWDGSVVSFERDGTQVRERARWTDGGRVLEVEGRWWPIEDPSDLGRYTYRYRLEGPDRLVLAQSDPYGQTVWHFARGESPNQGARGAVSGSLSCIRCSRPSAPSTHTAPSGAGATRRASNGSMIEPRYVPSGA